MVWKHEEHRAGRYMLALKAAHPLHVRHDPLLPLTRLEAMAGWGGGVLRRETGVLATPPVLCGASLATPPVLCGGGGRCASISCEVGEAHYPVDYRYYSTVAMWLL